MAELASSRQLRTAYLRWAIIIVPGILLLGLLSGRLSNSGYGNPWFDALNKPAFMPPGWAFGMAWSILYILMGLALALILNARGAKGRSIAIALFLIQLGLNLAWSPVFFALHRIMLALGLIVAILLWGSVTTVAFWRIRPLAGLLMLPYLAWLIFASLLNWDVHRLNPNGFSVIQSPGGTTIVIQ
ncbi:TspO/MBR family protein [Sphingomonas sp. SRS2]|uniref:TspO/MBR family protein n=1 Tax=Sphingomonas sp. SRS2 TaxID=133190 RepID=UPI00061847C8|nr:TspO/MBR family protein [Sphingomonas sp. SRS2]KKC27245.1 CrtK protein [Sphingomonas sp. SRS2]